jgi:acyl-coenzyme A synthetase/AMP-(fatty) acid ligase
VASDGNEPSAELADGIRADLRARLAGYKVPKVIVFLDALPTTPMGKVQKSRLRQLLMSEVAT